MQDTLETRTCRVSIGEDGILRFRMRTGADAHAGVDQNLEDARENVDAARKLTGGETRAPTLVDFAGVHSITREARAFYAGPETARLMTAIAILVDSFLSRAMGNFFMGLNKPMIPTRLFPSEEEALQWLKGFTDDRAR